MEAVLWIIPMMRHLGIAGLARCNFCQLCCLRQYLVRVCPRLSDVSKPSQHLSQLRMIRKQLRPRSSRRQQGSNCVGQSSLRHPREKHGPLGHLHKSIPRSGLVEVQHSCAKQRRMSELRRGASISLRLSHQHQLGHANFATAPDALGLP